MKTDIIEKDLTQASEILHKTGGYGPLCGETLYFALHMALSQNNDITIHYLWAFLGMLATVVFYQAQQLVLCVNRHTGAQRFHIAFG